MSFVCAFAWNYESFLTFRLIQGFGLGGEVPIAAVYISELARSNVRGRFVMLYELIFPVGIVAASLLGLWVVPTLGWQYMFVIGAIPAVLALLLRRLLPESPRWLASAGRLKEAELAIALIERETEKATGQPLPPPQPVVKVEDKRASLSDLFGPLYLRRTLVVWLIWFTSYLVNYGLAIWMPTVYRTVFKLPLDVALRYGLITTAVGLVGAAIAAVIIDHIGRKPLFAVCFAGAAAALIILSQLQNPTSDQVLIFITVVELLRQRDQSRRLSVYARALSDAGARARRRHGDGMAAVCVDDRPDGRGLYDRQRIEFHIPVFRRAGARDRRHHGAVRDRDQEARAGRGFALSG